MEIIGELNKRFGVDDFMKLEGPFSLGGIEFKELYHSKTLEEKARERAKQLGMKHIGKVPIYFFSPEDSFDGHRLFENFPDFETRLHYNVEDLARVDVCGLWMGIEDGDSYFLAPDGSVTRSVILLDVDANWGAILHELNHEDQFARKTIREEGMPRATREKMERLKKSISYYRNEILKLKHEIYEMYAEKVLPFLNRASQELRSVHPGKFEDSTSTLHFLEEKGICFGDVYAKRISERKIEHLQSELNLPEDEVETVKGAITKIKGCASKIMQLEELLRIEERSLENFIQTTQITYTSNLRELRDSFSLLINSLLFGEELDRFTIEQGYGRKAYRLYRCLKDAANYLLGKGLSEEQVLKTILPFQRYFRSIDDLKAFKSEEFLDTCYELACKGYGDLVAYTFAKFANYDPQEWLQNYGSIRKRVIEINNLRS